MNEPAPDPEALQRMHDIEQMEAMLRGVAETVVTLRRTLVDGGFTDEEASRMAARAWAHFFPGASNPLGFLFGGAPPE